MVSVDGYYKLLHNVTNYAENKSTFINQNNWEQSIELGTGRSYGVELNLKHTQQKLIWQAGYALGWSWRKFESINMGKEFPYKYDHRHTANIGLSYSLSKHLDVSGLWSYATGNVYTQANLVFTDTLQQAPNESLINEYQFLYHYDENNQYRAKSFQRYDVSVMYHSKKEKKTYSLLKLGVYHINGADDQYAHNLRGSRSSKTIRIKTRTSSFSLIPYISFSLRF